jgi:phosphate transport system substrate-binding protein
LSRPLYIFVKNSALRRPEVAGFVKYYLRHAGDLAKQAGYVAPTAADLNANEKAFAAMAPTAATAAR